MELTVIVALLIGVAIVSGFGYWQIRWITAEYSVDADASYDVATMPPPAAGGRGSWKWPNLPQVGGGRGGGPRRRCGGQRPA